MNGEIWLIIIGMALVTYIPRALPAVIVDKIKFPPRVEKFLRLIPYTAMAALIFPGIITVDPDRLYIGISGAAAAGLLAWFKKPLILCVLVAVGVNMLLYALIPT